MSNNKFTLEVHRRVYDDENGQYITVRPDTDVPDFILLMTDDDQKGYWGDVRLTLPAKMARLLGEALIAAANEGEKAA